MLLDSFKTLLKNPTWPMMLIFSGVDELADHLNAEEQLAFLLRSVRFRKIDLSEKADVAELNRLCFAYADHAGFDFSKFSNMDFYRRLALACSNRWGLVIELLIEALVDAISTGSQELTSDTFCRGFTDTLSLQPGFSPFSIEDYQSVFEAEKLLDLWMRKDSPK